MLSAQTGSASTPSTSTANGEINNQNHHDDHDDQENEYIRDIHALTPPQPPPPPPPRGRWETGSHRSRSMSMISEGGSSENFSSMSREFNALVLAGSAIEGSSNSSSNNNNNNSNTASNNFSNNINDVAANGISVLSRIGEYGDDDDPMSHEETNPLAIVPDNNPLGPEPSSRRMGYFGDHQVGGSHGEMSVQRVKKEEVETKISAWQNAKVAKIMNRFKREEAIINGWENERVQKASSWMKKVERKLEEKRVRALEKMQNEVAKARRKSEERRASAEAKKGTKVARVFEVANLMRAAGRAPGKRSFF